MKYSAVHNLITSDSAQVCEDLPVCGCVHVLPHQHGHRRGQIQGHRQVPVPAGGNTGHLVCIHTSLLQITNLGAVMVFLTILLMSCGLALPIMYKTKLLSLEQMMVRVFNNFDINIIQKQICCKT